MDYERFAWATQTSQPQPGPAESGAWSAIDERLVVNEFTGESTFSVPLRLTPGRSGFDPDLELRYNSSWGNSPFGFGWRVEVPYIGRKSRPEVPRYREPDDDTFAIGDDELVPALRVSGGWVDDHFTVGEYMVQRYRRRNESAYDRVERWVHQPSGQTHWRVVNADNVTSLFGANDDSRVSDPADSMRILRWLLTEKFDDRGNIVRFRYVNETLDGVDLDQLHEKHRRDTPDAQGGTRYLKRVQYGNSSPHDRALWHFEVVFDYGDHDDENPHVTPSRQWAVRPDPYSTYRGGFETRAYRRCARILMFHRFEELGDEPYLVSATDLDYSNESGTSVLASTGHTGFIHRPNLREQRSLPRLAFRYQSPDFDDTVHTLDSDVVANALVDPNARAQWIDLYGDGTPGVASLLGGEWKFCRFRNGKYEDAQPVPADALGSVPTDHVVDLDAEQANGRELAHDRAYQPLTTLRTTANINQDDPYVGYLDLNGDNADDVVVADQHVVRWYPSEGDEGFGDPIVVNLDAGDEGTTRRLFADAQQSFHVADMTGDGNYDLVRVRSGEVTYWPNRGRGRYGGSVSMTQAPSFPGETAGDGHVLLVDITGSGTTDLVWIGEGEIRYWENRGGNAYGPPRRVSAPGLELDNTAAGVDLFAHGSACILWLDRTEGPATVRYVDPVAGRRPNLLTAVDNNQGLELRIAYMPAADARRRDEESGKPWVTSMTGAAHVIEVVEARDRVAKTRRIRRYSFHNGDFDARERRLAGFARVEISEPGLATDYDSSGLFPDEPVPDIPAHRRAAPRLTKRWFHTGSTSADASRSSEYFQDPNLDGSWLSGHQMPLGQQARDIPESIRALRGQMLREEIYGLDSPAHAAIPYSVTESTSWVRQVQPARTGKAPAFDTRQYERIDVVYERSADDPRIQHRITLALDDFGTAAREACINYGSRKPMHALQEHCLILVTDLTVINRADQPTWYRIKVPAQVRKWQLVGVNVSDGARIFDARSIRTAIDELKEEVAGDTVEGPHKRLVEHSRVRYWANDLATLLPPGALESRALPARQELLALTKPMVDELSEIFTGVPLSELLQFEGGYEPEDGSWWAPEVTVFYDAAHFYLPNAWRDALGHETLVRYDSASLQIEDVQDAFGNITSARLHPRTLRPWTRTDANGNVVAYRYDPIGMVLSKAVMGKPGVDDADVIALNNIESSSHDNPTLVTTYDLEAWSRESVPVWVRTRHRDRHGSATTGLQDGIVSFDGAGRVFASAYRASESQWLVSGLCERDGNGDIVRIASPLFSERNLPDDADLSKAFESAVVLVRDALGRVVRTNYADGSFALRTYEAWGTTESDTNDTVLDSRWYTQRHSSTQGRAGDFAARQAAGQHYETRAAALAAAHAQTPTTLLFDAAGRVVVERLRLAPQTEVDHVVARDWAGRIVRYVDGRGITVRVSTCDLAGHEVRVDHCDAGTTLYLRAATGAVLRCRDAQGRGTRYRYDAEGRVTHTFFSAGVAPEILIERTIWGGGDVSVADVKERNLVGKAVLQLNAAGLVELTLCDFDGNVTNTQLRLSSQDQNVDWSSVTDVVHGAQLVASLAEADDPQLSSPPLEVSARYDGLAREIESTGFDNTVVGYEYGSHGQVDQVRVRSGGNGDDSVVIEEARYDVHGRPSVIRLGSDAWIRRTYDDFGRVTSIVGSARNDEKSQDLRMVYDPAGNLMSVSDHGELVASFTYDALYRLVKSEGLKPTDDPDESAPKSRRFSDTFFLDNGGNVVELQHRAGPEEWTKRFEYQADNNRLRGETVTDSGPTPYPATYQYDESGNVIHDPGQRSYRWDNASRLVYAEAGGGVHAFFAYSVDGELVQSTVERPNSGSDESVMVGNVERRRRYHQDEAILEEFELRVDICGIPVAVVKRSTKPTPIDNGVERSIRYQLTDHLGSLVGELSADADVVKFEPTDVVYRSARYEPDLGLSFLNKRWLSPTLGRYFGTGNAAPAANVYAFEDGNPQRPPTFEYSRPAAEVLRSIATQALRDILR